MFTRHILHLSFIPDKDTIPIFVALVYSSTLFDLLAHMFVCLFVVLDVWMVIVRGTSAPKTAGGRACTDAVFL